MANNNYGVPRKVHEIDNDICSVEAFLENLRIRDMDEGRAFDKANKDYDDLMEERVTASKFWDKFDP